ncbi:MAG: nucleoside deaminase [Bacillota bacterium]|nr:nucleoside deaminase [Bacillota bacterium]
MEEAVIEAEKAAELGEVPVGAVIIKNGEVIARAHNLKETLKDPTAHAEIIAIRKACEELDNWRLNGCTMYVSLEPCPMCAAAIAQARISKLHIGTFEPVGGACGSVINIVQSDYLRYHVDVQWEYNERCSDIITSFFKARRD